MLVCLHKIFQNSTDNDPIVPEAVIGGTWESTAALLNAMSKNTEAAISDVYESDNSSDDGYNTPIPPRTSSLKSSAYGLPNRERSDTRLLSALPATRRTRPRRGLHGNWQSPRMATIMILTALTLSFLTFLLGFMVGHKTFECSKADSTIPQAIQEYYSTAPNGNIFTETPLESNIPPGETHQFNAQKELTLAPTKLITMVVTPVPLKSSHTKSSHTKSSHTTSSHAILRRASPHDEVPSYGDDSYSGNPYDESSYNETSCTKPLHSETSYGVKSHGGNPRSGNFYGGSSHGGNLFQETSSSKPSYGVPSYGVPSYGVPSYGVPSYGVPTSSEFSVETLVKTRTRTNTLPAPTVTMTSTQNVLFEVPYLGPSTSICSTATITGIDQPMYGAGLCGKVLITNGLGNASMTSGADGLRASIWGVVGVMLALRFSNGGLV
ncbi:MAG: hypothetical protein M1820_007963 [Bogoriella megaspora]|nr:MAG: hypothetical protein M1820_007963 [Bogoriella megaspora]